MQIMQVETADRQLLSELLQRFEQGNLSLHNKAEELETRAKQESKHGSPLFQNDRQTLFLAQVEEQTIGYISLIRNVSPQQRHVAKITIGVLPTHRRQRVGSQLMQHGKQWAVSQGIRRLELTVASQNTAAISFYLYHDFVFEGIRKQSLLIDNQWQNELYMACQLGA